MTIAKKYKIWIFAGETSGDKYGAKLALSLKDILKENVDISGMGGIAMKSAGVNILVDSTELGVVGLVEVFRKIFTFIKIFYYLVNLSIKEKPDAVILIDYPGFNLRFAKKMHKHGVPAIWYISPHVWAWKKNRIYQLAKYCKKMLLIYPFEVDLYKKTTLPSEFVGHPLVDIVKEQVDSTIRRDPNSLLVLPGSRYDEIKRLFPILLDTCMLLSQKHPNLKFKISAARPSLEKFLQTTLNKYLAKIPNEKIPSFEIVCGKNLQLLQECGTGLAKSGTVTLECAIVGLPVVTFYKLNPLTFLIARIVIRKLFRNSFILPNIIADKKIYEEFLQNEVTSINLANAVEKILPGGSRREKVLRDINDLTTNKLTYGKQDASHNAATAIITTIDPTK